MKTYTDANGKEWQPIENAPRNGTILRGINPKTGQEDLLVWDRNEWNSEFGHDNITHFVPLSIQTKVSETDTLAHLRREIGLLGHRVSSGLSLLTILQPIDWSFVFSAPNNGGSANADRIKKGIEDFEQSFQPPGSKYPWEHVTPGRYICHMPTRPDMTVDIVAGQGDYEGELMYRWQPNTNPGRLKHEMPKNVTLERDAFQPGFKVPVEANPHPICATCIHLQPDHSHPCTDGMSISHQRGWICTVMREEKTPRLFSGWRENGSCEMHTPKEEEP